MPVREWKRVPAPASRRTSHSPISEAAGHAGRPGRIAFLPIRANRQIGEELFITAKTASVHVSRILTKLGLANRAEAVAAAHRLGLAQPPGTRV